MNAQTARPKKSPESWIPDEAREHARAARNELRQSLEAILPPKFVEHRRQARKEMLLACRSMIDSVLNRIEEGEKQK